MSNETSYEEFAPFYRAMHGLRSFFDSEATLVKELLLRCRITRDSRILDAACGTGDVLARLIKSGYRNAAGTDASEAMIAQSQLLQALGDTELSITCWQDLGSHFSKHGCFDFIFILGHALPHAHEDELAGILSSMFDGLRSGGVFAFDMRDWVRDQDGSLIELARPVGVYRWLGEIELDGCRFWIDDRCRYDNARQYVTYRIRRIREPDTGWDEERQMEFSYARFEPARAKEWLLEAGFQDVEVCQPQGWSYLVLIAKKP